MIVITGATGNLGGHVVEQLLAKVDAERVAVAVRNPAKASALAKRGVQVRHADYSKPETLEAALSGAEQLLLISSSEAGRRLPQHEAVIRAAQRSGVRVLAYTSILHADTSRLLLAKEHQATEQVIRASGLPFVFLRNGWYTENYTEQLSTALQQGAFIGCAGAGRVAAAPRADFAAAAVAVLTGPGHENKVYELAGDRSFSMSELASEVSRQSGKAVAYKDLTREEYQQILASVGLPPGFEVLLADADEGVARGELDDSSGSLRRLIGRPTTPLADTVAAALAAARP